ncbi:MAG TPA: hypothetical protein VN328_01255 [Thermodesulfovibrionales bacterium]|nr:hypothetical protein [Thermodesulfovibrionales bacterium]
MKYKIGLSTYNLDIIETFSALGNRKSQFIEQALIDFLQTEKGKNTLRLMTERTQKIGYKAAKGNVARSERKDEAKEGSDKIDVDSFLK